MPHFEVRVKDTETTLSVVEADRAEDVDVDRDRFDVVEVEPGAESE